MSGKDGGPAFPTQVNRKFAKESDIPEGLSLRDYFAGQALVGLLSGFDEPIDPKEFAGQAHDIANAMIAEREKE